MDHNLCLKMAAELSEFMRPMRVLWPSDLPLAITAELVAEAARAVARCPQLRSVIPEPQEQEEFGPIDFLNARVVPMHDLLAQVAAMPGDARPVGRIRGDMLPSEGSKTTGLDLVRKGKAAVDQVTEELESFVSDFNQVSQIKVDVAFLVALNCLLLANPCRRAEFLRLVHNA